MKTAIREMNQNGFDYLYGLMAAILIMAFALPVSAMTPPDEEELAKMREIMALKGPLTPEQSAQQEDIKRRIAFAKEIGNHKIDPYLLNRAISSTAKEYLIANGLSPKRADELAKPATPPTGWRGMPSTGNVKVFAILIDFSDHPSTNTVASIDNQLFGTGNAANTPRESLASYHSRASYGMLDMTGGSTLGWYRPNVARSAIAQTTTGRQSLIADAINHFDAQGHDFTQYDNDNDGDIDYFLVIWAGPDTGWGNFWWGYQTSYSNSAFSVDGKTLGRYSWQWEARPTGGTFSPVVTIHETGHALGLPDYYDYDDSVGPRGGVGGLDIMHGNWGDHNCFSKWVLDWVSPSVVAAGSQNFDLRPTGTTTDCVVAWPGVATNDFYSEIFVFQNRFRVGNDLGWPTDGLLAWHVDGTLTSGDFNYAWNNSYTDHKLIRLMEADGLEEIENGGGGDAGDYYKPGGMLTAYTTPNTLRYSGSTSGVEMTVNSATGQNLNVTVAIGAQDDLQVSPVTGFSSVQQPGETPSPSSFDFTLNNSGTSILDWSASSDVAWVDLSATSGQLAAGASITLTVTLNSGTDDLGSGEHAGLLQVTNDTLGVGAFKRPLSFSKIQPPTNDDFTSASLISGTNGVDYGSNVYATEEAREPKHGDGTTGGASVWWKWVPTSSGVVTIDTNGSSFDTMMGIYAGRTFERVAEIGQDDDGGNGRQSLLTFTAQAGTTYMIAVDGWSKHTGSIQINWSQSAIAPALVSSILPTARSGKIGTGLTAFATVINTSSTAATGCSVAKPESESSGFTYQTTDAGNNLTGTADTAVTIGAGLAQNFVFGFTPDRAFDSEQIGLVFDCSNTSPAPSVPGLNLLEVSSSTADVADLISIAATTSNDGIVNIPGNAGSHFFSASVINIGEDGTFTVSVDDAGAGLSFVSSICKTDSVGVCEASPASEVTFDLAKDAVGLFGIFISGTAEIPFDAANNRLFLRFMEDTTTRGATSVALRTHTE